MGGGELMVGFEEEDGGEEEEDMLVKVESLLRIGGRKMERTGRWLGCGWWFGRDVNYRK